MSSKSFLLVCLAWALATSTALAQGGKTIETGPFTDVDLSIPATVYVNRGPLNVRVEASPEDFEALNKEAEGDTWHIRFLPQTWRQKGKITIYISVPELEDVDVTGSGKVLGKDSFEGDEFEFSVTGSGKIGLSLEDAREVDAEVTGSGSIELSGRANELEVSITGSGQVDAAGLEASVVEVEISGSGNARVHGTEEIEASITGSGSVYYTGPARIRSHTTGSGKVKPMK